MKKYYSSFLSKSSAIICIILLFSTALAKAQGINSPDQIEVITAKISKQIVQEVRKQIGSNKQELGVFRAHYADILANDKTNLFKNLEDDSINANNTARFVSIMVTKYVGMYNQFKLLTSSDKMESHMVDAAINPPWPGACNTGCTNTDFESGDLSNWMACSAQNNSSSSAGYSYTTPTCTGIMGAGTTTAANYPTTNKMQVNITSALSGNDPIAGAFIPQLCPLPGAGKYSVEIGDYNTPQQGVGILEQAFTVTPANCDFTYWYAVVLESPGGSHTHSQQPYFNVFMYDQNGNLIPFCGNYSVTADSAGLGGKFKGFYCKCGGNNDTVYCRPWTAVFVPLKAYIGQCVTIKVVTSDCSLGGHFGYGYFDAKCSALGIIQSAPTLCGKPITLTAPAGGAAYQWTASGGAGCMTPPAGNTQSITINCPGKYTVVIQSIIGYSCADTLDTVVLSSVGTPPVPNFKSDTVCAGSATVFNNLTTGTNNNYKWTFQPGGPTDTSTAVNPSFVFPAAGSYPATFTVTLEALNNGCGGDTTLNVVVNGPPTAGFTTAPVCVNTAMSFTNTSTGSATYKWNFGDGSPTSTVPSPTHTYTVCGTYNVMLVVGTPPCVDTDKQTVTVNPAPTAAFTSTPACFGSPAQFTDASTIGCGGAVTTWSWNFGDGVGTSNAQNPTYTYPAQGCDSVQLTVSTANGCSNSIKHQICTTGPPVANFKSGPVCLGSTTQFTDLTAPAPSTYLWNFGDGGTANVANPTHTYGAAGTYAVKEVVASGAGCSDSITINVTVNPPPTSGFTATTVCQGTATAFTDTSHGGATYSWNFGDGKGTSTAQSPTYTYATAGTYQVKEVVTTASGCKDSITLPVTVNPNPTATITVPPVCLGTASVFTLTPTNMGAGTYSWAFGDAVGTSTVQNPSYTYTASGSYTATVTLTSSGGCHGTATVVAIVNPIPVANFQASTPCQGKATVFLDQSTIANVPAPQSITAWAWNFGDGGTSAIQTPTHTYAACGTYNVKLTVTSSNGCVDDTTITITVNPVPVPKFTVTSVCKGLANAFTDGSTIGCGGTITGWSWNFGDASPVSTVASPTHTYPAAGTYNATLTVTSNNGCDSTITLPVTVYPIPVPSFTDNSPCFGSPTNFTNTSTVAGGTIAAVAWTFGDGGSSNVNNPSNTYGAPGTYSVLLTVVSNHGCIDSVRQNVVVNPNPVPAFTADTQSCVPLCTTFTDLSKVSAPSQITSWAWNFGDGSADSSSTQQNPPHCYNQVGVFTVTLTVTSNSGCTTTLVKPNYITTWPLPVANFSANPNPTTNVNPTIVFTDESTGNPISWDWVTFGDITDSTATTENAVHTYLYTGNFQDTGTYNVVLVVKNKYGCVDTVTEPVKINPYWTFYVPNAFTPNADGRNDGFIGKGVGIAKYEMWIFDRWGQQLYHCTDMQHPWDGTVQGTSGLECQEDTYVYLIDIEDVFLKNHQYIGRVTIIR